MRFLVAISFFFFSIFFCFNLLGQKFHKAKVYVNQEQLVHLANNGISVDHGLLKQNVFLISDLSERELGKITAMGIKYDILIEDVISYYQNQPKLVNRDVGRSTCGKYSYSTPANFKYGSMAGYYTYQEYLEELDSMQRKYPQLITSKQVIDTFLTHENRPIYWVKISDNPTINESEPEVFYSAIHHAREVGSLTQLIYYMWYILENYGVDTNITHLLANTEQFFVPVINPDGYIYNETTNPTGGGLWRKNRRFNIDSTYGVDLNRNYGYQWGGLGASTTMGDDTYRGPFGFSEPETKAIKWFCEQHQFKMALNAHTYSNLLLYPYGYTINMPTADDTIFKSFSSIMVRDNGYDNILASALYAASGDSDDWMYGDQSTKPKIFAMTPEIGSSFWPPQSDIIPLCKENLYMNIMNAQFATRYAHLQDLTPNFILAQNSYFSYNLKRLGLDGNGDFSVQIISVSTNISGVGVPNNHFGLALLQETQDSISISLNSTISDGDEIKFVVLINNGLYNYVDTVTKIYGQGSLIFANSGTINDWMTTNSWNTTSVHYVSPPTSITDSPGGNYSNQTNSTITTILPISIPNGSGGFMRFNAKWDIELGWDYAQVAISTDGGTNWQSLCGKHTKMGNNNQALNEPVYDGTSNWVAETIDISSYLGMNVLVRFSLVSDLYQTGDGFYFDDFEIRVFSTTTAIAETNKSFFMLAYPNPTNDILFLKTNLTHLKLIEIIDLTGKVVLSKQPINQKEEQSIDIKKLKKGSYFIKITNNEGKQLSKKIMVLN